MYVYYLYRYKFVIIQLANDLYIFIYKSSVKYNLPIEYFNEWKSFIVENFKTQLIPIKKLNTKINLNHIAINHKVLQKFINNRNENFSIHFIDKPANIFGINCNINLYW